jgi:adenylylsulfate kinase
MTRAAAIDIVPRGLADDQPRRCSITSSPSVVWLTGLSGAGKSTIAAEVCQRLRAVGARVELIDGDAIRALFPATGFTAAERDAHIRRVAYFASRLEHHGVVVVCALISPYAASRAYARSLCSRFVEVHVSTPLDECERRDVKGLYRRARRGEIPHFTGIDDPYEPPASPELRLDTTCMSVADAADRVMALMAAASAGGA